MPGGLDQTSRLPPMRLGAALRGRRRVQKRLISAGYIAAAAALGALVPHISIGATVDSRRVTELLLAVGAAFVPFIGIIYSLLFLVVQFGSTTFTPRLNLFRDSAIVWHSFSYYTAVIVFCFTAAFTIGDEQVTTGLVPVVVMVLVLGAIAVFRALQASAFRSIQLAATLNVVAGRGRNVIEGVYPERLTASPPGAAHGHVDLRWRGRPAILQAIDVLALVEAAAQRDLVIELRVRPGDVMAEDGIVAVIHGEAEDEVGRQLLPALRVGIERTFDQDPRLALRVLADIALRALSPAINDPTTAVQALDGIDDLLRDLMRRELTVAAVRDGEGETRVLLRLPTWEEYVEVALDELLVLGQSSPQVRRRLDRLLTELVAVAPVDRLAPLRASLRQLNGVEAR